MNNNEAVNFYVHKKITIMYQYNVYLIQNNVSIETIDFCQNLYLVLRGKWAGYQRSFWVGLTLFLKNFSKRLPAN